MTTPTDPTTLRTALEAHEGHALRPQHYGDEFLLVCETCHGAVIALATSAPAADEARCEHRNISFSEVGCVDCGRLLERDTVMTDAPQVMQPQPAPTPAHPTPPATEPVAALVEARREVAKVIHAAITAGDGCGGTHLMGLGRCQGVEESVWAILSPLLAAARAEERRVFDASAKTMGRAIDELNAELAAARAEGLFENVAGHRTEPPEPCRCYFARRCPHGTLLEAGYAAACAEVDVERLTEALTDGFPDLPPDMLLFHANWDDAAAFARAIAAAYRNRR